MLDLCCKFCKSGYAGSQGDMDANHYECGTKYVTQLSDQKQTGWIRSEQCIAKTHTLKLADYIKDDEPSEDQESKTQG